MDDDNISQKSHVWNKVYKMYSVYNMLIILQKYRIEKFYFGHFVVTQNKWNELEWI